MLPCALDRGSGCEKPRILTLHFHLLKCTPLLKESTMTPATLSRLFFMLGIIRTAARNEVQWEPTGLIPDGLVLARIR